MTIEEILDRCTIELLTTLNTKDDNYKYPFKIIFADKTELILAACEPMPWCNVLKVLQYDRDNYVNIDILFDSKEQYKIAKYVSEQYEKIYSDKRKNLFGKSN